MMTRSQALGYGTGQVSIAVFFQVTSLILLPFMTNGLAIPAAIAGAVILLPKLAAIPLDTFFGIWAERMPQRIRAHRPLLLIGGALTAVSLAALFAPPVSNDWRWTCAYMLAGFVIANIAFSALSVTFLSAAPDVSRSSDERTLLMSWRMGFHMTGILVGGAAPALVLHFGGGLVGYRWMGALLCLFCLVFVCINYAAMQRIPVQAKSGNPVRWRDVVAMVRAPGPFRRLLTIYVMQYFSNGILYSAYAYFAIFVLGGDLEFLSWLAIVLTVAALLAQPVWVMVERRIGKQKCYMAAVLGNATGLMLYATLSPGEFTAAYGVTIICGIFTGGAGLMAWSLFLDCVEQVAEQEGERRESLMAGAWSALEKAALAVGVFAFGGLLQLWGLVPSSDLQVIQPDSALVGIRIGVSVLPPLGLVFSGFLIYRWMIRTPVPGAG